MPERTEFWLSHLPTIQIEGITTKAYGEREGLSVKALHKWRKRLVAGTRRDQGGGGFVPVQIARVGPAVAGCTVVIDTELRLECAALPSADWLAALSAALRERVR